MSSSFFTVKDVAKRYGVTVQTVRKLAKNGKLPKPIKIGHKDRWNPAMLESFENTERR